MHDQDSHSLRTIYQITLRLLFVLTVAAFVFGFSTTAEAQFAGPGDGGEQPEAEPESVPPQIVDWQIPEYAYPGGSFNLFALVMGPVGIKSLEVVIGWEKTMLWSRTPHAAEVFTMDFTPRRDGELTISLTPIGMDGARGRTVSANVRVGSHDAGEDHGGIDLSEFQRLHREWNASGLTHLAPYERGDQYKKGDMPPFEWDLDSGSDTFGGDSPVTTDGVPIPRIPDNWWLDWQKFFGNQPFDYQAHCGNQVQAITPNGVVLRCWLALHPKIGNLMVWSEINPQTGAIPSATYANWTENQKDQLDVAFYHAFKWLESGLGTFNGMQLQDPPDNQFHAQGEEYSARTILNRTDAWNLYLVTVAHSLALEIGGFTPWSVLNYTPSDLNQIFSSHAMYHVNSSHKSYPDPQNPGVTLYGYITDGVTHAPPLKTFQYFVDENLFRSNHFYTIARMLKWGREHMQHYAGKSEADNIYKYWHYVGAPPVSRIIDGVIAPDYSYLGVASWVKGCHGVANFFESAFRAVNIPVDYLYGFGGARHGTAVFTTIGRTLSHGDDVHSMQYYIQNVDPAIYIPPEDVMITYDLFDYWFFPEGPNAKKNVGRQPYEIDLDVLSNSILDRYCDDIQAGAGYLGGSVYQEYYERWYSVAQLVNMNLWGRLEQKRQQFNYCDHPPDCSLCHDNQQRSAPLRNHFSPKVLTLNGKRGHP